MSYYYFVMGYGRLLRIFLHVWYWLPIMWRRILTAVPICAGVIVYFIIWEWVALAAGAVLSLILFSLPGPSESEKRGYHF